MMYSLKIICSIFLIISPSVFSYVVFRQNPIIHSNSEAIDLIDEYPITDKSMPIEHRQKIPKKDDKLTEYDSQQQQQQQHLTISDLTTFLGLNENYFAASKSTAKELQALLSGKNSIRTSSDAATNSESISNELLESNSNEGGGDSSGSSNTSLQSNSKQEPLNFGEVLTLLALWHLANAFNDYTLEEAKHPITTNPTKKSI